MIVAVTGGIGAGKSTVCNILRVKGFEVYDCDSRAKAVMDSDAELRRRLRRRFGPAVISEKGIDRRALAEIVFNDAAALDDLNALVHNAVKADIHRCAVACTGPVFFIETAILYQSGLNEYVDRQWLVEADESTRVRRVMRRNGLTADEVKARIKAQEYLIPDNVVRPVTDLIDNSDDAVLLPQVNSLLQILL